ncbi:OmpA family protein [Paracoccus rhizosphaerae]|uniref:OmpA family protein n=1 Tax=Paracoccus rhizosphaerae TaxID=1133347 RepID=A0ABV6CG97_9RHOB|nr:OmpA family protein [Paracoccus rhizosphaerae]
MRRIIHNSTALAACLSLLAPHLAAAQQIQTEAAPTPGGIVLAQAAAPEDMPANGQAEGGDAAAVEDLEAALAADEAEAAEEQPADGQNAAAPVKAGNQNGEAAAQADASGQSDDAAAEANADGQNGEAAAEADSTGQDGGAAAQASTDGSGGEAAGEGQNGDAAAQAGAQDQNGNAPAQAGAPERAPAPKPERAAAPADAAPEQADAAPAADAPAAAEAPSNAAAPAQAETQVEEQTQDLTDALLEEETAAKPQADDAQAEAPVEAQVEEETQDLTEALREAESNAASSEPAPAEAPAAAESQAQPATGTAEPAGQPTEAAAAAEGGLRLAAGGVQTDRAGVMPGLANVLQQELSGGLQAGSLTCLSGGSFPCADNGRAMTPRGVVVETNQAGELRLAPVDVQMYRVGQNGELVRRAAEEDTPETEASREAAQASAPVNAAALDAAEGQGEVTEQTVTEETARSSSEEFATNLRDALAAATGQQPEARAEEDDDDNDLTRALLLGLGAVAVGTYLNNNRQVALSTPDRVVVTRSDGSQEVIKDEVALLRQPGATVTTENFDDGSSRTIVTREDGSRVVTIRDADLRVLRRTLVSPDGQTTQLIDETADVQPVDVSQLPAPAPVQNNGTTLDEAALREALQREADFDRRFTLSQIRNIPEVRALVAPVNIDAITFDTGSAAIRPNQAEQLQSLGAAIRDVIAENPQEIFMIEGHTDTVGSDAANLALSDRRAESVALALTEYFDVPPENLVTQGYGEQFPRVRAEGDIRENRRASVRRITDLLAR